MSEQSIKKQRPSAGPSRRRFLKTTLAGALLAGAFPLSEAQAKVSKSAVYYQKQSLTTAKQCSDCQFFVTPNACRRVAGNIGPKRPIAGLFQNANAHDIKLKPRAAGRSGQIRRAAAPPRRRSA